jgi:hypothetical protein
MKMEFEIAKDCEFFVGIPPKLKKYKKGDIAKLDNLRLIDSISKQGFLVTEEKEDQDISDESDNDELNDQNTEPEADKDDLSNDNDESDNDTPEDEEDDLKVIFGADPERLTIPELKGLCDEYEITYHHNTREATLIKKITEFLEA